jgi:hypothetical protein
MGNGLDLSRFNLLIPLPRKSRNSVVTHLRSLLFCALRRNGRLRQDALGTKPVRGLVGNRRAALGTPFQFRCITHTLS